MSAPASAAAAASSSAMDDVPTAAAAAVAPSLSLTEEKESGAVDGDEDDDEEGTIVQEEFKIWKKNAPYLYDCVVSHALEWPSLSCQWLPDRVLTPERDFSIQRLILGTHTSVEEPEAAAPAAASSTGAAAASSSSSAAAAASSAAAGVAPQNYLMIAEVRLPHGDPSITAGRSAMQPVKFRGGGSNKNDALQLEDEEKTTAASGGSAAAAAASAADVDAGGYGAQQGKIDIVQRINHQGEVNRARYSPFNPNLIATKSSCAEVFVFDRSKHSSHPGDSAFKPDLVLTGHTAEGYGLAWNPHASSQGMLLSGSNDSLVCLWDISAAAAAPKKKGVPVTQTPHLAPVLTLRAHTAVVEDVAWSPFHAEVAASCGDDSQLLLWDIRVPAAAADSSASAPGPTQNLNAGRKHHQGNINAISFNLFSEHILASGASDGLILLWDLRRPHSPIHTLSPLRDPRRYKCEILNLSFAPFSQDILLSSGSDRRAYIWDLSRIGASLDEQADESAGEDDDDVAPPELLFAHGGHTDKIADLSWNPNEGEEWMVASVADDNVMQIWQISETVYADDEADTAPPATGAGAHDVEEIE